MLAYSCTHVLFMYLSRNIINKYLKWNNNVCGICYENKRNTIAILICGHWYHLECLNIYDKRLNRVYNFNLFKRIQQIKMIIDTNNCPICRNIYYTSELIILNCNYFNNKLNINIPYYSIGISIVIWLIAFYLFYPKIIIL